MKNKFFLVAMAAVIIFAFGCNKDKKPLSEKTKSREQADKSIAEVENLEREMQRLQELEKIEKESEKITSLKEPPKPLTNEPPEPFTEDNN